jgi:alkanesulfonate monooxygenase SsuD/methylene tetrahydromethanopterin reductase-like flavin-dependent oxidoreductase (luciferase family)
MRYGLEVPAAGLCGDAAALAELAHIAEEVGWDGICFEDYICYQGDTQIPTYDPWVALAALSGHAFCMATSAAVPPP